MRSIVENTSRLQLTQNNHLYLTNDNNDFIVIQGMETYKARYLAMISALHVAKSKHQILEMLPG